jgi:2-methylcitrate dehydratase PrpD
MSYAGQAGAPGEAETELVQFAQSIRWATLPATVRASVLTLTADAIGTAICGRTAADTMAIEATARALYGMGGSSILGGGRASLIAAATVNAFQTTAYTMCDVYRPGLCHVTPEVVPAGLALAERDHVSGTRFLEAVTAGLEITTRICQAMTYPVFRARGWHNPGIAGAMGAAITAGLLAGLDDRQLAGCLGLAGSQAGGTFAAAGTVGVKFHQMNGARSAITAALHAEHGLLGPANVLTAADGGLLAAFSDAPDPKLLSDELGERWDLLDIALRAYPAASTLQSLITCLLAAETDAGVVRSAVVYLPDEGYRLGTSARWESELRAMQSPRFVLAVVLATRRCWIDVFSERYRSDPEIVRLAEAVDVRHDSALPDGAVRVELDTADGPRALHRDIPFGDPADPMTATDLVQKLGECLHAPATDDRITRLLAIDTEPDVAGLLDALRCER